jgi:hypothetical protein
MASGSTQRTVQYEYVDVNGIERTMTYLIPSPVTTWTALPLATADAAVCINSIKSTTSLGIADTIYVSHAANAGAASVTNCVASISYIKNYTGVITCPTNAIMFLSNVMIYNAVASNFVVFKCDATSGARKQLFYYNTAFAINHATAGNEGSLSGILTAGDSMFFGNENNTNMVAFGNVVIKYLS